MQLVAVYVVGTRSGKTTTPLTLYMLQRKRLTDFIVHNKDSTNDNLVARASGTRCQRSFNSRVSSGLHRHSTIVGNLQFLDNVQLRESGIGSQIADFEKSRLFGRRRHLSNGLST